MVNADLGTGVIVLDDEDGLGSSMIALDGVAGTIALNAGTGGIRTTAGRSHIRHCRRVSWARTGGGLEGGRR